MDKAEDIDTFKAKLRFRRALARGEPGPERDLEGALDEPWRPFWRRMFGGSGHA